MLYPFCALSPYQMYAWFGQLIMESSASGHVSMYDYQVMLFVVGHIVA
jgi:hypothetical protein